MKRVIAYLRVSTEQQDTKRQLNLIQEYCEKNNCEIVKILEDKVSGTKDNRAGLLELLTCDKSVGDLVIVSEQSRLSRGKALKLLVNISEVLDNGLDLLFLDKQDCIYKSGTELETLELMGVLLEADYARKELEKITQRLKTGKELMYAINPYAYMGGLIPFGFEIIPNPLYDSEDKRTKAARQVIAIKEDEAEMLLELFSLYANGMNTVKLHRYFLSKGYKIRQDSLLRLLSNEVYIGKREIGNKVYTIEPIIPKELFDKVQLKKQENKLIIDNANVNGNIFKGLLCCQCGFHLALNSKDNLKYYACYSKYKDNVSCEYKGISEEIVLKVVYYSYMHVVGYNNYNEYTDKKVAELKSDIAYLNDVYSSVESDILNIKSDKIKVSEALLYADSKELKEIYNNKFNQLTAKEKELTSKLTGIEIKIADKNNTIQTITTSVENLVEPTNEDLRSLYRNSIDKIIYNSTESCKGILTVIYKNGIQDIYLVSNKKGIRNKFIANCPQTFKYNVETGLIEVELMNPLSEMNFSFSGFETKAYTFNEIIDSYGISSWKI